MNFSSMTINALINVLRNLNLAQLFVVRCIKSLSSGNVVVGSSCSLVINRNDSKFCTVIIFHYSNFVFAAPLGGACSTLTEVEAHINKIVGTFCHRWKQLDLVCMCTLRAELLTCYALHLRTSHYQHLRDLPCNRNPLKKNVLQTRKLLSQR